MAYVNANQGTHDGIGSADHDEPFEYRRPTGRAPFPFTERQFAHLLVLRGRLADGDYRYDNEHILTDGDYPAVSITDAIGLALLPF